jgi:hypothetical protein
MMAPPWASGIMGAFLAIVIIAFVLLDSRRLP